MFTRTEYQLIADALDLLSAGSAERETLAARCRKAAESHETMVPPVGDAPMRCPSCGNDDPRELLWVEDMPVTRKVHGALPAGTIVIDDVDFENEYELAHTQRFRCMRYIAPGSQCLTEWPTPDSDMDYLSSNDFRDAGGIDPDDEPEDDEPQAVS